MDHDACREEIAERAAEVFRRHGYAAVGIGDAESPQGDPAIGAVLERFDAGATEYDGLDRLLSRFFASDDHATAGSRD